MVTGSVKTKHNSAIQIFMVAQKDTPMWRHFATSECASHEAGAAAAKIAHSAFVLL